MVQPDFVAKDNKESDIGYILKHSGKVCIKCY